MKKLIPFLAIAILLASCSKDDENQERTNPVVGSFQLESVLGNNQAYIIDPCFKNTLIVLNEDRTGNHIIYGDASGECDIVLSGSLQWRNTPGGYFIDSNIGLVDGFEDEGTMEGAFDVNGNDLTLRVVQDDILFEILYKRVD